jgi:two-component system response regulator PilR (NtrC family)
MTSRPTRVLVVDDEPDLRTLYELTLLREGLEVVAAQDVQSALDCLSQQQFDVLITDMRLPDGMGLELLAYLNDHNRSEHSIVITAYGSPENAVQALKAGAFDYLTKPVDLKQLRQAVSSAARQGGGRTHETSRSNAPPNDAVAPAPNRKVPNITSALVRLVGDSTVMQQVRQRIAKVATSMAPVLVLGESGTGKELVARAIHDCSHRADGPFVAVNCAAIPENLIEAEFFGARKGAYTGATHDRTGFFEAARGGTLFLDEIGDLPLQMQAKLLRAIQERRIRPLGAVQEEDVDVRLVSATHRDLNQRVQIGEFRQDLFYRLNVIEIKLPALRERSGDLQGLIQALLQRLSGAEETPPTLSVDALEWLMRHPLPGNVRELENLLHKALALRTGSVLRLSDFDDQASHEEAPKPLEHTSYSPIGVPGVSHLQSDAPASQIAEHIPHDLQQFLDEQERQVLLRALQECNFNRTAAAARLGLNLRQMRYRIQRLGIVVPGADDAD